MGNSIMALLVVLGVNLMLWFGQFAILDINPEGTKFAEYSGNVFGSTNQGSNDFQLNETNPYGVLPKANSAIDPDTGNIFTDIFNAIKDWFATNTGARYLQIILSAPYNFLKALHLPNAFVYGIGTFWYMISLFVIVSWIFGRES